VLVQPLAHARVNPRPAHPFAPRAVGDLDPAKSPIARARKIHSPAQTRTLDNHLGHVRSHHVTASVKKTIRPPGRKCQKLQLGGADFSTAHCADAYRKTSIMAVVCKLLRLGSRSGRIVSTFF